jgi:hypothetical protein
MVNIIQNISRNHGRITITDLRYALAGSALPIYPGVTAYSMTKSQPFMHKYGHSLICYVYAVKGVSDEKASVVWTKELGTHWNAIKPISINVNSKKSAVSMAYKTNSPSPEIYPELSIKNGEIKVIIELDLFCPRASLSQSGVFVFPGGKLVRDASAHQVFGFLLLNPPCSADALFFSTVIIFTPKHGIFSENEPI